VTYLCQNGAASLIHDIISDHYTHNIGRYQLTKHWVAVVGPMYSCKREGT